MANIYVRSTDGLDADNGTTWALAKATLTGAAAIDAAGDTIYISDNHSESTAAAITITLAGTRAAPSRILCVDDTGNPAPPTALATTAVIQTTGASAINYAAAVGITYGLNFKAGSAASSASVNITGAAGAAAFHTFQNCKFELTNTATASRLQLNNDENMSVTYTDCSVKFGNASQGVGLIQRSGTIWNGGSILSGGTSPTTLFATIGNTTQVACSGLDLSNGGSAMNIFAAGSFIRAKCSIRNCKLPASWSGSLVTGTIGGGSRFSMYNCDSGDTNYRLQITDFFGSIVSETTIVRTSGASDGTTPLSWKMTSGADAEYPALTLDTDEIVKWNETTGSAITATVEIITDNVTLTDGECWLEVQYLGTSGFPLGAFLTDAKADVLATAANQTSSSETWTTTGLTTPLKQKLSVTFTPQEKGYVHAVVHLAKASTTVYVDPLITIT